MICPTSWAIEYVSAAQEVNHDKRFIGVGTDASGKVQPDGSSTIRATTSACFALRNAYSENT